MEAQSAYKTTLEMTKEQWQEARQAGIGGSDAAAALGINPYKTSYDLWLEKTNRKPAPDLSEVEAVVFGQLLEDVIADHFTRKTNFKTRRDNKIRFHKEHGFLLANIDRLIVGEEQGPGVLEIKTTNGFTWKNDWNNGETVPAHYWAQIQHYFAVTGYSWGYFAVLVDGRSFNYRKCDPDWEYITQHHIPMLVRWWNAYYMGDTAPGVVMKDIEDGLVMPQAETTAEADESILATCERLADLKGQKKKLDTEIEGLEDELKIYLANAEYLVSGGQVVATYKAVTSNRFDSTSFKKQHPELSKQFTKETSYRALRLKGNQ